MPAVLYTTAGCPHCDALRARLIADGRQRTFQNDLDSEQCCYFFGVRKEWRGGRVLFEPEAARGAPARRRLT